MDSRALLVCDLNRTPIDQSHRYGRPQVACREPAGSYDKTTRIAICFEQKTQYLLIHAPYTHIVVFWHISNIPPMILQSQISCNTPTFYIAAIFVKYCYCYNPWANLRCSGCYPLGEKIVLKQVYCYGKARRLLCPFFRNLHLRENLARDCFTSTAPTVTNSVQNNLYPSTLLWQINGCNL